MLIGCRLKCEEVDRQLEKGSVRRDRSLMRSDLNCKLKSCPPAKLKPAEWNFVHCEDPVGYHCVGFRRMVVVVFLFSDSQTRCVHAHAHPGSTDRWFSLPVTANDVVQLEIRLDCQCLDGVVPAMQPSYYLMSPRNCGDEVGYVRRLLIAVDERRMAEPTVLWVANATRCNAPASDADVLGQVQSKIADFAEPSAVFGYDVRESASSKASNVTFPVEEVKHIDDWETIAHTAEYSSKLEKAKPKVDGVYMIDTGQHSVQLSSVVEHARVMIYWSEVWALKVECESFQSLQTTSRKVAEVGGGSGAW